jgi:hypothetical protein
MIESPIFAEWWAQASQHTLLKVLEGRFGPVPPDIAAQVKAIGDETQLDELSLAAGKCPDQGAFRTKLGANYD